MFIIEIMPFEGLLNIMLLSDGWPGSPAAKPGRDKRTERDSSVAAATSE
jgi:hypothetical protein